MTKIILTFSSVTYALKGRKILTRAAIGAKLVKIEAELARGCTYGIEIENRFFLDAVQELKNAGISYSVYNP